ncbi:MAG: hypothetical protein ACPGLV_09525 [Bacteroidia bacterium]
MKTNSSIFLLLSLLTMQSCRNFNRPNCSYYGHYPQLNYKAISTGKEVNKEAVFELMEMEGGLVSYTHIKGDTIEPSDAYVFEKRDVSLGDYIDSLSQIGHCFELRYYINQITEDAEEPAPVASISRWYFVDYQDSSFVPKDFGEAILPVSSKTEAYILAVSENDDYNAFWYPDSTVFDCKIQKLDDSYLLNLAEIKGLCDPQEIEAVTYNISFNGLISSNKGGDGFTYDCKCE